jgi:hypothetical protein
MSEQNNLQDQIIAKAMKDEAFRQQLLSNPKETLEHDLGITLPQGVTVQVHEDTPTNLHLVLPMQAVQSAAGEPRELSEAELEGIAGGGPAVSYGFFTKIGGDQPDAPCEFQRGSF